MENHNLRFTPGQRIIILSVLLLLFTVIGSVIVGIIVRNGMTTQTIRISSVVQDCIIFVLPAVISAVVITPYAANFLGIDRGFSVRQLALAVLAFAFSIPAMNALVCLNEGLSLPSALSGLEEWMRNAEMQAQSTVELLLGTSSVGSLIVNLLIVGVLAGFSEEIFFRGSLQRLFMSSNMSPHVAIWLTAAVFSAFHLQFFGFFPRLLLGVFFGYLFYWTKSLWLPIIMHILNNSLVVYSMWLEKAEAEQDNAFESLNDWGVDSPALIIASLILTGSILYKMHRDANHATA